MSPVPLSVLDLVPVSSGATTADAVANAVDLARRAEGVRVSQAAAFTCTDEDRELVADRLDTQFVGAPATVAARLVQLQEATGADELVVTTITHGHADRVRSYELLAKDCSAQGPAARPEGYLSERLGAAPK